LSFFFYGYVVSGKILQLTDVPNALALPKAIGVIETPGLPEAKGLIIAKRMYWFCGVKLTYATDAGGWKTFEPGPEELQKRKDQEDTDKMRSQLKSICEGQMWQFRYLFAFHLGALFLTFTTASLWLTFRKPV